MWLRAHKFNFSKSLPLGAHFSFLLPDQPAGGSQVRSRAEDPRAHGRAREPQLISGGVWRQDRAAATAEQGAGAEGTLHLFARAWFKANASQTNPIKKFKSHFKD